MTPEKKKVELKRVSMNLPADLVQRVISYGEKLGLNTTSAYIVLLNQALDQKQSTEFLPLLSELYNKYISQGKIDDISNILSNIDVNLLDNSNDELNKDK